MISRVTIANRYCGPRSSGNGGYVSVVTALALGGSDVEVALLAPAPLERTLVLEQEGEEAKLLDRETVIAVARPTEEPVDIPFDGLPLVAHDAARREVEPARHHLQQRGGRARACWQTGFGPPDRG